MENQKIKDDVVLIDDSHGSTRKLRLFLSPSDGDIYVSIVEPGDRIGLNSVRICTRDGNPPQGDINNGLREAFYAALNNGYGENYPFINLNWESKNSKLFDALIQINKLEEKISILSEEVLKNIAPKLTINEINDIIDKLNHLITKID